MFEIFAAVVAIGFLVVLIIQNREIKEMRERLRIEIQINKILKTMSAMMAKDLEYIANGTHLELTPENTHTEQHIIELEQLTSELQEMTKKF